MTTPPHIRIAASGPEESKLLNCIYLVKRSYEEQGIDILEPEKVQHGTATDQTTLIVTIVGEVPADYSVPLIRSIAKRSELLTGKSEITIIDHGPKKKFTLPGQLGQCAEHFQGGAS